MSKDLGMKYRKDILAPGRSVDSIDSLRKNFSGGEHNDEAFLKQNNLM